MKSYIARTANGGFMCFGLIDSFVKNVIDFEDAYDFIRTEYGRTELPLVGSVLVGELIWNKMSEKEKLAYLEAYRKDVVETLEDEIFGIGVAKWKNWVIIPVKE
jgi:hypothetical protein